MTPASPSPLEVASTLTTPRKEFLHSMFTTALEGGIGYWSACRTYHWSLNGDGTNEDLDGFHAVIEPSEDEWGVWDDERDRQALTINLDVMHTGAIKFLRHCHGLIDSHGNPVPEDQQKPLDDDHYWRQWLVAEATNGADGDYDAEVADQVVQWGLFGHGVYG